MKKITAALILVAATALSGTAAMAQTLDPQVPNPSNPFPANPIATDGSSLLPGSARPIARGTRNVDRSDFLALAPRNGTRFAR